MMSQEDDFARLPEYSELEGRWRTDSARRSCWRRILRIGVQKDAGDNYPHDPDDLRRCILFLDAAEAHDKVQLMASVSPQWAGLVRRWGDLVATFKEEMAAGKSAPKTYAMMREAIGE